MEKYTTHKEMMVRETQQIDMETGAISTEQEIYYKAFVPSQNFVKVYLSTMLEALGLISNSKQLDVVLFLAQNTNPITNQFVGSQQIIAKHCNTTRQTVAIALKKLITHNFLKPLGNGAKNVYMVNPNLIVKGNETHKRVLIDLYSSNDILETQIIDVKSIKEREIELEKKDKQNLLDTIEKNKEK